MKIYKLDGKGNASGERVKIARERCGISQSQLAARLQVAGIQINQKAISRIENGERIVADYEVIQLSTALNVDPLWLLTGKESK